MRLVQGLLLRGQASAVLLRQRALFAILLRRLLDDEPLDARQRVPQTAGQGGHRSSQNHSVQVVLITIDSREKKKQTQNLSNRSYFDTYI